MFQLEPASNQISSCAVSLRLEPIVLPLSDGSVVVTVIFCQLVPMDTLTAPMPRTIALGDPPVPKDC